MKALVHTRAYEFELREVATPSPGDGEILVRVKAVGICGSDIHGATGKTGRRKPPLVMGHEASGVIEQVGSAVTGFSPGDRITFDSTIYCGKCSFCSRGRVNLCDSRMVLGVSCDDYKRDGAMAEYLVIPQHIAYHIPDSLSFPEACMVEAASIAVHAVSRTPLSSGASCAVVGTGLIGLLAIQVLKLRDCGRLTGFDVDEARLELAGALGADETVNMSKEGAVAGEHLRKMDAVIEAVGIEETIATSLAIVRRGGAVTGIGNLSAAVEFPLQDIVTGEISFSGSCASSGEYPECIDLISSGKLDVKSLISRVVPLEEGAKYFDILVNGREALFKVILEP